MEGAALTCPPGIASSANSTSNIVAYERRSINSYVWERPVKSASDASPDEPVQSLNRPAEVWVITAVLTIQTLAWAALGAWIILELVTGASSYLATALFEVVLVVLAVAWMAATVVGTLGVRPWSRASLVAIEVLHIAAAIAAFQGYLVVIDLGWLLLVPAILALVLAFTPRMTALYARRFQED